MKIICFCLFVAFWFYFLGLFTLPFWFSFLFVFYLSFVIFVFAAFVE